MAATVKISELPAGTPNNSVQIPGSYSGTTFRFNLGDIGTLFLSTFTSAFNTNDFLTTNKLWAAISSMSNSIVTLSNSVYVLSNTVQVLSNSMTSFKFATYTNSLAGTNYFIDPAHPAQAVELAGEPALLSVTNVAYNGTNMTMLIWVYNNTATNNYWYLHTNIGFTVPEGNSCGPFTNSAGTRTLVTACIGPDGTNLSATVLQNFR